MTRQIFMFTSRTLAFGLWFSYLIYLLCGGIVFAQEAELNSHQKIDAVLVIDNSLSMDFEGHDPKGRRFEGAKILIDECDFGDQIAIIDFSSSAILIQPLLEVTKTKKAEMKRNVQIIRSDRKLTDIEKALQLALHQLLSERAKKEHKPVRKADPSQAQERQRLSVVILLTDGEIDVIYGTEREKLLAAQRSEASLIKETLPKYIQNYVPIYTVAMKNVLDTTLLQTLAEKSKLREEVNEEHFFQVLAEQELVEVFAKIICQIKKRQRITRKLHFTGQPIQYTTTTTPFTNKLDFEVLLDHKKDMNIALSDPEDKIVEPSSFGAQYNVYSINKPTQGQWRVKIDGTGENQVILTTFADEDIKIDLPFPSRFKLGDDIPILATISYRGKKIYGSTIQVELHGQSRTFNIGKFLLRIQRPDGKEDGSFTLQKAGLNYTFFYKEADKPGKYTLNFELNGDIMGKDIKILGQKDIVVFQSPGLFASLSSPSAEPLRSFAGSGQEFASQTASLRSELPVILFKKLKDKYRLGDAVELEFSVTENANLMQSPSIPVEVRSPSEFGIKKRMFYVPREGPALYAIQYTETDVKGEYTFIAVESEEYKVVGAQQSTLIVVPYAFPWKIAGPIFIVIPLLAIVFLRGWPPLRKGESRRKGILETEKEEFVENAEKVFSMPNEILFWKEHYAFEQISLILDNPSLRSRAGPSLHSRAGFKTTEGTIPCRLECAKDSEIILNDTPTSTVGIMLSDGDIVKYDKFAFKMELKKDAPPNIQVDSLEDLTLRVSMGKKVRWSVGPINPQPPMKGATIPLNFIFGDVLYIGRDEGIDFAVPNDIALRDKNVASRQLSIRRSQSIPLITTPLPPFGKGEGGRGLSSDYFLKALDGETILNGNLLEDGNEIKLNDGDIAKIGALIFGVILTDKKQPQLKVIKTKIKE